MFTKSANYYDALYRFKDYAAAATAIDAMVREYRPGAASLLDVGCGTGLHLANLRDRYDVAGLDLNGDLLAVAAANAPGVPFHQGDMTDFDLGRRFDVVTCLFSSVAYVKTQARLEAAVARMRAHLAPGGLLLIEPWISPEDYWDGHLAANYVDEPDLKLSWMYVQQRRDNVSVLDIHYQAGTPQGVHQFREIHEMGLFTQGQYEAAFRAAGLDPHHDPAGFFGRGLYWAQAEI